MSIWTHALCDTCYGKRQPGRVPVRVVTDQATVEACCDCGTSTRSGIYYREDPLKMKCKGKGGTHGADRES